MEEDDNIPTGEEDRSIENSGWSTRTRLVLFIFTCSCSAHSSCYNFYLLSYCF